MRSEGIASDDQLRRTLTVVLSDHLHNEPGFVQVHRRPAPYQSSFRLEELDVITDEGTSFELMFKVFDRDKMLPEARELKPSFLYDARREIFVYRNILAGHNLGTPRFYGAVCDDGQNRYWLFTERVKADVLWQIGEFGSWKAVANWLGAMHKIFSGDSALLSDDHPLLSYTKPFLETWFQRAEEYLQRLQSNGDWDVSFLAEQYAKAVNRIAELPRTFLHGEFYASNILLAGPPTQLRICPIDWELAAIGPGLIDLAALTAGSWAEDEREILLKEYLSSGPCEFNNDLDVVQRDLDYCRLYIAIQWLAVFGDREPYWNHKHDWLGEARILAKKIASSSVH